MTLLDEDSAAGEVELVETNLLRMSVVVLLPVLCGMRFK